MSIHQILKRLISFSFVFPYFGLWLSAQYLAMLLTPSVSMALAIQTIFTPFLTYAAFGKYSFDAGFKVSLRHYWDEIKYNRKWANYRIITIMYVIQGALQLALNNDSSILFTLSATNHNNVTVSIFSWVLAITCVLAFPFASIVLTVNSRLNATGRGQDQLSARLIINAVQELLGAKGALLLLTALPVGFLAQHLGYISGIGLYTLSSVAVWFIGSAITIYICDIGEKKPSTNKAKQGSFQEAVQM